jgi:hypothetical protein
MHSRYGGPIHHHACAPLFTCHLNASQSHCLSFRTLARVVKDHAWKEAVLLLLLLLRKLWTSAE